MLLLFIELPSQGYSVELPSLSFAILRAESNMKTMQCGDKPSKIQYILVSFLESICNIDIFYQETTYKPSALRPE